MNAVMKLQRGKNDNIYRAVIRQIRCISFSCQFLIPMSESFNIQSQKSTLYAKRIWGEHPVRISLPPRFPKTLILLLRLEIRVPNNIEIKLAK